MLEKERLGQDRTGHDTRLKYEKVINNDFLFFISFQYVIYIIWTIIVLVQYLGQETYTFLYAGKKEESNRDSVK